MKAYLEEKYAKLKRETANRQERRKKFELSIEGVLSPEEQQNKLEVFDKLESEKERENRKM